MATYFMDTSALVKRFHYEAGSRWVRTIFAAAVPNENETRHIIYVCGLSIVEVPAALAILERTRELTLELRDELYRTFLATRQTELIVVPITDAILSQAAALTQRHPLKAYDAVQLASALDLQNTLREFDIDLVFVASDNQLLRAAQTEGLQVENPESYPNS